MKINENFLNLKESYLFSQIAHNVEEYQKENPEKEILRLGVGDVTRPLCPAVVNALTEASQQMGKAESFHGYGPEQGYPFLREEVQKWYKAHGVSLDIKEIFISDGAKSDCGNFLDILSEENTVLIPNPVYPVYLDTNIMAGRKILFANATKENGFLPLPDPKVDTDVIYLCSPNNPTGAVYTHEQLKKWVDYALEKDALILFDAAYESFVQDESLPHSIYEVPNAKKCAVEICSFSKTAGFTGTRCGYTVVPFELNDSKDNSLNALWLRRQTTKFNGTPYIVQKGAAAVFSEEGQKQTKEAIKYYLENAQILANTFDELGIWYTGGKNAPYIWAQCPGGKSSWEFFDFLLSKAGIVGTPGAGFGSCGEGFFRFSSFGDRETIKKASEKLLQFCK